MMAFLRDVWRSFMAMFNGKPEEEIPRYTFYDTLEEFGYHFNEKGELRDNEDGRFKFVVREGDRNYNQQHYDALGELVTEHLYSIMENKLHLERVNIPSEAPKMEPQTFIFMSKDALDNDKLMVLIHGSGAVRAGQWSRKLIINEDIDTGSQLPYIRRALDAGYGVIVLNPNLNEQVVNGKPVKIKGNESPEDHGVYVWENFVTNAKAQNIAIVAHSYGGIVTCKIAESFLEDFKKRVFSIVFTDSVHSADRSRWSQLVKSFMKERAVNFASAYLPLDTQLISSHAEDCPSISAGTVQHERTSHSCIESAFKFIRENFDTWTKDHTLAPRNFLPLPDNLDDFSPAKNWEKKQKERAEKEEEEKKKDSSVDGESPAKNSAGQEAGKDKQTKSESGEESKDVNNSSIEQVRESSSSEQVRESSSSKQGEESSSSKQGEESSSSKQGEESSSTKQGEESSSSKQGEESSSSKQDEESSSTKQGEESSSSKQDEEKSSSTKQDEESSSTKQDEESSSSKQGEESTESHTGKERKTGSTSEEAKSDQVDKKSDVGENEEETKVLKSEL